MYLKVSEHKIQGETEWSSESLKLHEHMITAVVVAWQWDGHGQSALDSRRILCRVLDGEREGAGEMEASIKK